MKFRLVNRHTRAGSAGKVLKCPKCGATHKVFSFQWKSLGCPSCNALVNKYEWLVCANTYRRVVAKPTTAEALATGSVVVVASMRDESWRSMYYLHEEKLVLVVLGEGLARKGRSFVPLDEAIDSIRKFEERPDEWSVRIRG